jgi:transposase
MKLFLDENRKNYIKERVRKTRDAQERVRLCVILNASEGMTPEVIAEAHLIGLSTVYRYLSEYSEEGKILYAEREGSKSKLSEEQTRSLLEHLKEYTYLAAKEIREYVYKTYGMLYSRSGMTFWLHQQGFVYKEPVKVPGRLDPAQQDAFIEKYKELKAQLPEDEEIYFLDAVHPAFQSQSACGWIYNSEPKTLPTTNAQYRVHFIGAIALKNMEVLAKEYKMINGESTIEFLEDLEKHSKAKKIHIICDNGRSNRNKAVEAYVNRTSRLEIHYLPPYSPNLNPIERLWKFMREKKTYNRCYACFSDFKEAIYHFFYEEIPKYAEALRSRINDSFQRIYHNTVVFPHE